MREFTLAYCIENRYEQPVRKANFQLLVIPDADAGQKVLDLACSCSGNLEMHSSKNIFGFTVIQYYLGMPFSEFWFKMSATVQKPETNPFYVSPMAYWDEWALMHSLDFQIDNHLFLRPTTLTTLPPGVMGSFPAYAGEIQIFDYLLKLNASIFQLLEYSPESTDVNTSIDEVLHIRKGVCQDYAHLFISVCRSNNIPARYVSGYLDQGAAFIGTSQLHAWVEAFIPGLGWIGFDSTNDLVADHHYIKIAHGTDYRDCSPIIGVLGSTGTQTSIHSVTVTDQ